MIYKRIFVIAVSLTFVVIVNVYFNNIVEKYVKEINDILDEIKIEAQKEKEINNEILKKLDNTWNKAESKMALFVDHDEIEKAEVEILLFKSNLERQDYDSAIEKIDKAKYMFKHIKEKGELKIRNIF